MKNKAGQTVETALTEMTEFLGKRDGLRKSLIAFLMKNRALLSERWVYELGIYPKLNIRDDELVAEVASVKAKLEAR